MLSFIDDHTRYTWLYPLRRKSDFFECFLKFQILVENQLERRIKIFQSDGGGEFQSIKFQNHLSKCGILQQVSCLGTPEQNGIVERKHRHIVEMGLTMLFNAKLPLSLWVDAFLTAVYLINRLPSTVLKMESPFFMLFKQYPEYRSLRIFGCQCFPYLRDYGKNKFSPKTYPCVFIGYSSLHKGYRCLHPSTKRVYISRHVIFNENCFPYDNSLVKENHLQIPIEMVSFSTSDASCETSKIDHQTKSWKENTANQSSNSKKCSHCPCTTEQRNQFSVEGRISARCNTKQNTEASCVNSTGTPTAVATEISTVAASKNDHILLLLLKLPLMFLLVPVATIPTLLLLLEHSPKLSLLIATSLPRYKARLVARGFSQIPGLDFGETFNPVIKHTTTRLIFSLAVTLGWKMRQLDVKNAFLHGFLKEEVFMEQPPGFINEDLLNHVCKLNRSLYGLKQAPRAWFDRLSQCLLHLGFCCGKADSSLFILHKSQSIVLLLIYVDDIIVIGNDNNIISDLISTLSSEFSLKDLGSLHYFLGLEVKYLPNGLFVSQTKYIRDLLEHTKMMECTPINTPLALKSIITSFDEQPIDPTQYRQLVGSLQYLTFTRPGIVHAVNKACQHFQAPTKADLRAVKRILRYLKGTMEHGIRFFKQSSLRLTSFCDVDWAGCTNTRRSTSGAAEITWLTFLLRDIGIQLREPPQLLCDNLSALHMTLNPVFHARSKHIELDYHFVREKVASGVLITHFLPSSLLVADIFTKALPKTSFQFFRFKLGVHKFPLTSLRGADKGNSDKGNSNSASCS
ncbi:Retrovirus-related Pol polyprotein from transposon TNT 1-94 [Vitis vinifera]|uniref:Retrovirus-related Pol polyprotein from transposon TNT 1-94 n=1 Tax=Vitis vinifera TaxID=29760 RepID=A0A438JR71_VITVI|nr:Retrovirus-related Pol polyprotein from transposon TNT 1-94 [Vitis vinifera]